MKFATQKSKGRHGEALVVSKDLTLAFNTKKSLLEILENWPSLKNELESIYSSLNQKKQKDSFSFVMENCVAPIPHAPGFYDGSSFLSHVVRARKARGDVMPESAKKTPLMYQGVSDNLLSYQDPIELMDESYGGDCEGEWAVITSDVPKGEKKVEPYVALICMFNDITFREIVKQEIETKFGFLQSKPNSSFAPIVVTPDELGGYWNEGRIDLELEVKLNSKLFGHPHGREMHFSFFDLIRHAGRTRPLSAGSIVGSGTVSNDDKSVGFATLVEKRYQEILDGGGAKTLWLKPKDQVYMNTLCNGQTLFGPIQEEVVI